MNARLLPALVVSAALLPATALAQDKPGKKGKDKDGALPPPEVTGLLQVWGTVYDQDENPVTDPASYGDPEDDTGFKVRRARIGLEGKDKQRGTRYDITFGFSSGYDALGTPNQDVEVISASGGVRPVKGLWIDGGVVKVPTSRSFLMSASELATGDRAVGSNWMIPAREVGLQLDGRVGSDDGIRGRARVGVFNGNGSLFGDDNPGKMIAARVEGIVGPGDTYKTYGTVDSFTLGFAGDFWMSNDLATNRMSYGGDIMMRVAGLAVLLEGHLQTIEPSNSDLDLPGVLDTTPRMGTVAQVGYTIDAWEPVVRFSTFDDHREFDDNGDVAIGEGGFVWHGKKDQVRAGALYVTRLELQGQPTQNDSARVWMQLKL